jgi:hypothetical protein
MTGGGRLKLWVGMDDRGLCHRIICKIVKAFATCVLGIRMLIYVPLGMLCGIVNPFSCSMMQAMLFRVLSRMHGVRGCGSSFCFCDRLRRWKADRLHSFSLDRVEGSEWTCRIEINDKLLHVSVFFSSQNARYKIGDLLPYINRSS